MINLTSKYLLMIEPIGQGHPPINDRLSEIAGEVLASAIDGLRWRGVHGCVCGECSGCCDLVLPNGVITNSLMAHYIQCHRDEIPDTEIVKLRAYTGRPHPGIVLNFSRREVQFLLNALGGGEVEQRIIDRIREDIEGQLKQQ
jgi:hypothetical protein